MQAISLFEIVLYVLFGRKVLQSKVLSLHELSEHKRMSLVLSVRNKIRVIFAVE